MKSKNIYFWACDYQNSTGEGRLANLFINKSTTKNNKFIKINLPSNKILNYKYISPFLGVLYCWIYFLKGEKTSFINYLPMWNFLIFLLLPPRCFLGPITGGAIYTKSSEDYYFREFFFPILYKITNIIFLFRYKKLLFSTELLKKEISKKIYKKCEFNFIIKGIKKNKKIKKKYNFLFYFRKHKNKKNQNLIKFINFLVRKKIDVMLVGNKLKIRGVKNLGFIKHEKLISYLSQTRYSLVSDENIFSLFTIDAINNNVQLLIDKKKFKFTNQFRKNFIKFNFKNISIKKLLIIKNKKCL